MSSLEASLSPLVEAPGVSTVALVDAVTGLTYSRAGAGEADGVEYCEFATLVGDRLHAAGAQGELESIVITGARHHLVLRTVPQPGDPLLLAAVLERDQVNLALVLRQLSAYTTGPRP
ncbi:hypothetical protein [Streptomyces sp. NPDC005423]|uniref:hypothetical protein n=1 Tax=Streptomyces sp. NPDC005423 TaxID=3155343 RepID=UPI0033B01C4C